MSNGPSNLDHGSDFSPRDGQWIECFHCGVRQRVSQRALMVNCRACSKLLRVEALVIENYQARRVIETCGSVTVELTGNVFSDQVICSALVVRGRMKANILCRGPVLIGPKAQLRGDVTAGSVAIGEGAILDGNYRIGRAESSAAGGDYRAVSQPPPSAM